MRSSFLTGALFLGVLSGCPGRLDDPERFDSVVDEVDTVTAPIEGCGSIESEIFGKRCATSGCHTGFAPSGELDLGAANLFARLENHPATSGGALLVPGDPKASVIFQKISATPPFGDRMPPIGATLDDKTIDCVRRWIEVNK